MPKQIRRKIGEIHEVDFVKTPWDKVKEFLQGMAGLALIGVILIAVFG